MWETPQLLVFRVDEYLNPFHEPAGNLCNCLFARNLAVTQRDEWIPERGATYRKSRETGYFCRNRQPFDDFILIRATSQNNAPNIIAAIALRHLRDLQAIVSMVQSFNLPYIRFNAVVLQLCYC